MDQSLEEVIRRSKLIKSEDEITRCGLILRRPPSKTPSESSRCSLDEFINTEEFADGNIGTLSSLEYVNVLKRRREDRLKVVASGISDKKSKFLGASRKMGVPEMQQDDDAMEVDNTKGKEAPSGDEDRSTPRIDSLQVLDLLANAGNRIQIVTHRRKTPEDEDIMKTSEWKEQRWVVEVFLVGLDKGQENIVYSNVGVGASFRKVVAKYAAAENLFANLRSTGYITNFPPYYTPMVVRLNKNIFFDLKRVAREKGEILTSESRVEFANNDRIIHVCEVRLSDEAISAATHRFEEQAQYIAASKAYTALTGEKYELEKFIKGDDVDYDLDDYDTTEEAGITVATTPHLV